MDKPENSKMGDTVIENLKVGKEIQREHISVWVWHSNRSI